MSKEFNAISKYFSYLLRHRPNSIGLSMDENGWVSIDELVQKTVDFKLSRDIVAVVVETNDKQRFSISENGAFIRANQGHSVGVHLGLKPIDPPEFLLHGTAKRFIRAIRNEGLKKMQRHHVHLSDSQAVARSVGARYGKPIFLQVAAKSMHNNGFIFYRSVNNVWLVESVPIEYIEEV
ncbi:RNA 2'-phosphotransferase [Microbulbifer sp. OS29]|uniref:Probable RNA 2'-phosphotransferase n=1 Tax=Microbulbifer okhotskensis TaxID=2926617 RepID=A0A9X2J8K8_9GAMM|nr:RNA 2'-phosphotransferase [Microbulbifer okhotskensis]MCO1336960.1 RNA 2'-phosphotransferase [Microbulbifer okhotskensis]